MNVIALNALTWALFSLFVTMFFSACSYCANQDKSAVIDLTDYSPGLTLPSFRAGAPFSLKWYNSDGESDLLNIAEFHLNKDDLVIIEDSAVIVMRDNLVLEKIDIGASIADASYVAGASWQIPVDYQEYSVKSLLAVFHQPLSADKRMSIIDSMLLTRVRVNGIYLPKIDASVFSFVLLGVYRPILSKTDGDRESPSEEP